MKILFTASFLNQLKKLSVDLREEAMDKIELFSNEKNHQMLKVHKLHGQLKSSFSFSVNYRTRIVFKYLPDKTALCEAIGDHDLYK